MDNLEDMDRFLEKFNLPRLNADEIEIMNNPITNTEIEAVIRNLPQNKSLFFEKINKIDKSLARLIKKKREKSQINKIRNEKGEVTTGNAKLQRIITDYYEQLHGNKMDNLEEMDRSLAKFDLPSRKK